MDKHYVALEFDKVLKMLSECAQTDRVKQTALETPVYTNLEKADKLLE